MANEYRAAWDDLTDRLTRARRELVASANSAMNIGGETTRLNGKRQGIDLALDYMRGYGLSQPAPACGNREPHRPHNGFATSNPEPWCKGVPDAEVEDVERLERDDLRKQIAKLENDRDTLRADLSFLRRWLQQQRDGEEKAVINLAKKGEMSGVVGAVGRMKAYSTTLDELARLERS